ncbi:MAG: hypothetical protein UY76_C0029G0004 [Candidatus Uhrbacteria bacterium GW2011_GWA2_52_8d]|uniref:Uncharacterized protein n=1 Tax=Candidatus Uhrbacteria bacterium GW2011_GWA2_52_8d TaxID=1618979 RepID=A0A0G1XNF3_9BACT|nr:MAG: hypothetical protein UY76_C0029G0004 [Candidatus Uhrbacteria bacterium GW2011_GWA2_52_8d]
MGAGLSTFDREAIRVLRTAGVLRDYVARGRNGQIVVACSDGDQMKDLILHKWLEAIKSGRIFRPHMLANHGGAMNVDPSCTLYPGMSRNLLEQIRQAEGPNMKGITSVNLCIHAPCSAAGDAGMTILDQLWHQYRAAERVSEIDSTNSIIPTLHVDYGEDKGLVEKAKSSLYREAAVRVQAFADELGVGILIPLLDGHRRRTYHVDLPAFARFWESTGREMWGHLFEIDPTHTLTLGLGSQIHALA